jgi:hypothetical protein
MNEMIKVIPEYIVHTNSNEKNSHYYIKCCAIAGTLEDLTALFEVITGCRDTLANWRAIFEVSHPQLVQLLCGKQGL